MNWLSVFSLAIAMFVLAATPGPGVFAIISRSLASGFAPSLKLIAGLVTGDIIFLLSAIMGMSFIAQIFGQFFAAVKIIGGAYLIFLGVKIWKSVPFKDVQRKNVIGYGNYLSGIVITLSNPKVILFYCGFLPTFIDLASLNKIDIGIVTAIVAFVLSSVLILYAFIADRARLFLSGDKSVKRLNKAAGFIMISAGIAVAIKS